MGKQKWQAEKAIGEYRVYARTSRSEIVVRVEKDGDTTKYAEWGMPKFLGLEAAMAQGAAQTRPDDILP